MRIDELFVTDKPTISFEFFPPKDAEGAENLFKTIERLRPLQPSFVSITRTGGGTEPTIDLTSRVQKDLGIRTMAHLTCVGHTKEQMKAHLQTLWDDGVRNVLALRGDLHPGQANSQMGEREFAYATDLVAFVKEQNDFAITVAGYPEGHPQCLNITRDLEYLKQKQDMGATSVITQLFFDNNDFYRWRDQSHKMGVTIPLVAGLIPIQNVAQIKRFVTSCGAKIQHDLLLRLEAVENDADAVYAIGLEHALKQCQDLLANGVDGLHFYTLNRSKATRDICQALKAAALK
jgi:methylenetetrahydrofolate reductase (NADPH)